MPDKCNPQNPSSYPERILVATLGLAPQVLTETLYCLAKKQHPPFVPTQIHILTTTEGAHRAKLTLLDPSRAKLKELETDHSITGLSKAFCENNIHIISSKQGNFLNDIDCAEDNAATADLITGLVRTLALEKNTALHVSIAGGRKTMGFLLGYALSLFGRPQDRLSHVLVTKPFQDHPDFFFPPTTPIVLQDRENRPISTADSNVILSDVPVVRLRDSLPATLLSGNASYSQTVDQTQKLFNPASMTLEHETCLIICHGIEIKLPPQIFALAAWMARQLLSLGPQKGQLRWDKSDWQGYIDEYANIPHANQQTLGNLRHRFSFVDQTSNNYDDRKGFFEEKMSRLKSHLKKDLGPLATKYLPRKEGPKGYSTFTFPLHPDAIKFI